MLPVITTFAWVPPFARGFLRDIRARWACGEVGQPFDIVLISKAKLPEHRRLQPFGQVPTYRDDEVEICESGAVVLRIAERAAQLIPIDPAGRFRAIHWLVAALNSVEPFIMTVAVNDIFEADRDWSKARHAKVAEGLHDRLQDLEAALGDNEWIDEGTFTVGDLVLISVLGGLRGSPQLDRFSKLAAYVERGEARPAHRKAMDDQLALYADLVRA